MSLKRARSDDDSECSPRKLSKGPVTNVHPFFAKSTAPTPFQWIPSLGTSKSCLHAVNLSPKPSPKIAAFDLDGTLIKDSLANSSSWEWWRTSVPIKLTQALHAGYAIIIISNQALKPKRLTTWKLKIPSIAMALPDVPFRLFAATARDNYRKPMIGMWTELEHIFAEQGVQIDKSASFFVGDAAGRQYAGNKCDFASTDRKWALNVGIPFFTPEEYFLQLPPHTNFSLPGFNVSSLPPELPLVTPTSTALLPPSPLQELVLFVGYPCMGKTSFYNRHFKQMGYVHINQDTLKTRDKCVKATKQALQEGKSCVVDNTNRNAITRKFYLDIAKTLNIPTRCFFFTGPIELAWHNNLYRAFNRPPMAAKEPKRELIPYAGFTGFRDNYEEPQVVEGLAEIKRVNWVFEGTAEEKRYWSMWLQIDGK